MNVKENLMADGLSGLSSDSAANASHSNESATSPSLKRGTKSSARGAVWQRIFRTRAEDSLPHTVAHQRIYIVPSKRGAAFLTALLLMLIASVNYSLSLGYALCFLLTGLFAATLLHTYRNLAGITVQSIDVSPVFAGETINFSITLINQKTQPRHGIRLQTQAKYTTRARVEAEASAVALLAVDTSLRGRLTLGRLTLQSDWPLGLWTTWSYLHVPVHTLVFPAAEISAPAMPSRNDEEQGVTPVGGKQGDVSGLRDYVAGDSIGSIAWKSAARGLGLHVRTFDSLAGPATTMLDLRSTALDKTEAQLSRLCAWVLEAESNASDYGLQLPHVQLEPGHGRAHRLRALEALALHEQPLLDLQNTPAQTADVHIQDASIASNGNRATT